MDMSDFVIKPFILKSLKNVHCVMKTDIDVK